MDGRRIGVGIHAKLSFFFSTSLTSRTDSKPWGKELACRAESITHNGPGSLPIVYVSLRFDVH